ncbi:MAG: galactose mutarotase [Spirochaetes bacterium]|nr:galactose mutarotase [Spirochaetota bacterium]
MNISEEKFGEMPDGGKALLYTLEAGDIKFRMTNYGAAWTNLWVPSKNGGRADVLLGFSDLAGYLGNRVYMGATIGRVANRIGGAAFEINGRLCRLDTNDGKHSLHGGSQGFDKRLWKATAYKEGGGVFVRFELESPDGDGGYPGNLKAAVTYGLNQEGVVTCLYEATVDRPCPVNLTNHAYFNLAGGGSILSHEVRLFSSSFVEVDEELIPTGRLCPVENSEFDLRKSVPIVKNMKPAYGGRGTLEGYDHSFALDGAFLNDAGNGRGDEIPACRLFEPESGRVMEVNTTQPGLQFYTGNMLPELAGRDGAAYKKHSGLCLETQHFPDTPNQRDNFPDCTCSPDAPYRESASFAFKW